LTPGSDSDSTRAIVYKGDAAVDRRTIFGVSPQGECWTAVIHNKRESRWQMDGLVESIKEASESVDTTRTRRNEKRKRREEKRGTDLTLIAGM
jgi:hypothetical protein